MSIRITYTKARLNVDIGYQTTCKSCGTTHGGLFCCGLDTGLRRYTEAGKVVSDWAKNLVNGLTRQLARGERAVRCPKCRAIDPTAQARLKAEDAGEIVHARFKYYVMRNLWMALLFLSGLAAFYVMVEVAYFQMTPNANAGRIHLAIGVSAAVLLFTYIWYGYLRIRAGRGSLEALSEEEMEDLLDLLYFESGDDLRLWALAINLMSLQRHARPWLPRMNAGGTDLDLQNGHIYQHYPPLPILKGNPVRRLRQAIKFSQDKASYYATGRRFPRPPESTRISGGPGQWNWCYGYGTLLLSHTPASKEAERALQSILHELRALDRRKQIAPSTVVTVRMKPDTREWGVLIVNPRRTFQEEDDLADVGGRNSDPLVDFPLPLAALKQHHQFIEVEVRPLQVFEWVKSFSQQITPPMEFADEQTILVV